MDRNIVTRKEAEQHRLELQQLLLTEGEKGVGGPGSLTVIDPNQIKPDTWYERLLNYTPAEAIALYLGLDGIIRSAALSESEVQFWLGAAVIVSLVFTWLFLQRVWKVERWTQRAISMLALLVYIFALGGFFATFAFYRPWQGTALLAVAAAFLALADPPGPTPTPRLAQMTLDEFVKKYRITESNDV